MYVCGAADGQLETQRQGGGGATAYLQIKYSSIYTIGKFRARNVFVSQRDSGFPDTNMRKKVAKFYTKSDAKIGTRTAAEKAHTHTAVRAHLAGCAGLAPPPRRA